MILVDSSIWIAHFRQAEPELVRLLNSASVLAHPFVSGELALGHLKKREEKIACLLNLPQVCVATDDEVLHFIELNKLFGTGIGYIDVHLLAAAKLSETTLWTRDKALLKASKALNLAANLLH
jgi:predicted nucleic acid-binding protein